MSFKREGDDASLLRNLKHRRVCELLANHIPDDEGALLSNGRLTCVVCSHRPIFDTMNMLAIHRKGKKHIAELGKYLLRKRELEERKLKADHWTYLRTGSVKDNSLTGKLQNELQSTQHGLLAAAPYNSCSRKRRHPNQRKTTIDIISQQSDSSTDDPSGLPPPTYPLPSASAQVRLYLKSLWRKKPLEKMIEKSREQYGTTEQRASSQTTDPRVIPTQQQTQPVQACEPVHNTDERNKAEYYMKLRMAGWQRSSDGKWIKDPEAEFDSDEEEPSDYHS